MNSASSLPRLLALLLTGSVCLPAIASEKPDPVLEKGRYLVHNVAGCIDCHSPRDERGQFIADRHLTGAVLGFAPTVPMPWAPAAPSLVGLEGYTAEQAVKFFTTGERPSGIPPRPPMPEYRLTEEDAKAVIAYLKSLAKKS